MRRSQRIAVGVKPSRGQSDQAIADGDAAAVDQHLTLDCANDKPCEIVLAIAIETWHLGGFSPEARTRSRGSPE